MIGQPTGSGYFSRTTPSGSHLIAHRSAAVLVRFGSWKVWKVERENNTGGGFVQKLLEHWSHQSLLVRDP